MSLEKLDNAFDTFKQSAFRLQLLPTYDVGNSNLLERWNKGEPKPPEADNSEWNDFVRERVSSGATMTMVHVVDLPLNDYVRYCMDWWYPDRIAAGETVVAANRSSLDLNKLPDEDFWMFDNSQVFVMKYTTEGKFIDAVSAPDPEPYLAAQDYVLKHTITFDHLKEALRT